MILCFSYIEICDLKGLQTEMVNVQSVVVFACTVFIDYNKQVFICLF